MTISFSRYININSTVGAATTVNQRNFGGRLVTNNLLLPPGSILQTTEADDSKVYFGSDSPEYLRAVPYFNFISKNLTAPNLLSYSRWVDSDVAPRIYGAIGVQVLATYTAISDGSFGLTIGGVVNTFTALDFSAAVSLANVASIIQTAIHTKTGTQWTASTVTYDNTRGAFVFVGGSAVAATITVQEGVTGTPIAGILGWLTGAILCDGALIQTITETLGQMYSTSNNFGSFVFVPVLNLSQDTEASVWTDSLDVQVMYFPRVSFANASAYETALAAYSGVGLVLSPLTNQYPEQLPMEVLAATDYTAANSVQNYMYQQDGSLTPSVTNDTDANTLDTLSVNYYGNTQNAGQIISFFQRGVLYGPDTAPAAMNVFANEMWLKDACGVSLLSLLLGSSRISANSQGRAQILTTLQGPINQGLSNGTISISKTLTVYQQFYITQITHDPNAWQQVQNFGYWLDCDIVPYTALNGDTQYKAVYTLIYSKDDAVYKVDGFQALI